MNGVRKGSEQRDRQFSPERARVQARDKVTLLEAVAKVENVEKVEKDGQKGKGAYSGRGGKKGGKGQQLAGHSGALCQSVIDSQSTHNSDAEDEDLGQPEDEREDNKVGWWC